MESWLPWLTAEEHLLPDLLPASALVALVEPRRLRDRAQELLDEEAALAHDARGDVGRGRSTRTTRRACRCRSTVCSRTPRRSRCRVLAAPDHPDTPVLAASAFDPVVGDVDGLAQAHQRAAKPTGYRVIVAAEGSRLEGAHRGHDSLAEVGAPVDVVVAPLDRGVGAARRSSSRSSPKPTSPAAGACTARRAARARASTTTKGSPPGDFVVHRVHGVGRYLGMETREMFGVTRDRLVVEFKGGDRVYVDSEDIGLIRKYTGGEEPKLSKMGGADWEKTRGARAQGRARHRGPSSSCSTAGGSRHPGTRSAPDTPFQQQIEDAFPYEETPDQAKAIVETKADMERADADGPPHLRRRRLRQDRGRAARRGQGGVRRQAGRDPRADHAAREPARADVPRTVRELSRCASRCCRGSSRAKEQTDVVKGVARRHGRHRHRHAPAALATTSRSRTSGCSSSTRSSASACSTRSGSRSGARTSTC